MKTIEFYGATIDLHKRTCDWCPSPAEFAYERIDGRKHTGQLIHACLREDYRRLALESADPKKAKKELAA